MAAESLLGEPAGEIAIGAHEHRHAGQRARQHLRLVARVARRARARVPVADHHHAVGRARGARSRGSESRDARPCSQQHARQRSDDRRLAAAADDQVADADDRAIETRRAADAVRYQ